MKWAFMRQRRKSGLPASAPNSLGSPRGPRKGAPSSPPAPSLAALESLVEDSDQGMILADASAIILYANRASERLLGHSPQALRGRVGFDMVDPDDLPAAQTAFGRCLETPGEVIPLRVRIVHNNGSRRVLDVRLVNRLAHPGVNAVVVHFRAAEHDDGVGGGAHYREVFECAPIGLGVADLEGRLLLFNEAMLRPGGYQAEDIHAIGNVARLYYDPDERTRALAIARQQGFLWRHEVQFVRKDGTPYDTLLTLAPVKFGEQRCWLAAVEDVTDQKRAEAEQRRLEAKLLQAEKMEAVGRMTAGIAHDFNNVLSVILASSQLIVDALPQEPATVHEDLLELRRSAGLGVAMVRKLLGYSRSAVLNVARTDFGALVQSMGGMLRHLVPPGITVEVQAARGSWAVVDPSAIEQMLLNLVTNARDAIQGQGTVRIEVTTTELREPSPPWLPAGSYVRLAVTDDGVGMDDITRARALEPFFTTKRVGAGTGLGLSMVYGLAKQQRGFVEIQSAVGAGTTVSLFFPEVP
jgi:PAS domain S-box-containing protein